jgi:hypothetical protein
MSSFFRRRPRHPDPRVDELGRAYIDARWRLDNAELECAQLRDELAKVTALARSLQSSAETLPEAVRMVKAAHRESSDLRWRCDVAERDAGRLARVALGEIFDARD